MLCLVHVRYPPGEKGLRVSHHRCHLEIVDNSVKRKEFLQLVKSEQGSLICTVGTSGPVA